MVSLCAPSENVETFKVAFFSHFPSLPSCKLTDPRHRRVFPVLWNGEAPRLGMGRSPIWLCSRSVQPASDTDDLGASSITQAQSEYYLVKLSVGVAVSNIGDKPVHLLDGPQRSLRLGDEYTRFLPGPTFTNWARADAISQPLAQKGLYVRRELGSR
ncbi:uncharacterized protein EI90DRAFT_3011605 [Cantharellus anzutake]|uniref:uncharacterized protein n=1 Tax=Cantharellus anzutake TaxID=1750568 RepID=UPI0019046E95|nr:uncharacterized protein EI90DRAFT_3011605 [Cantharellus anzutake]KAF8342040.1 hypothetical protein EI90DRAFT_3011605 [Cantharellus anzutake]